MTREKEGGGRSMDMWLKMRLEENYNNSRIITFVGQGAKIQLLKELGV